MYRGSPQLVLPFWCRASWLRHWGLHISGSRCIIWQLLDEHVMNICFYYFMNVWKNTRELSDLKLKILPHYQYTTCVYTRGPDMLKKMSDVKSYPDMSGKIWKKCLNKENSFLGWWKTHLLFNLFNLINMTLKIHNNHDEINDFIYWTQVGCLVLHLLKRKKIITFS